MKKIIGILTGFVDVIKRFPLTMLSAIVAAILSIYLIENNFSQAEYMPVTLTILTAWLGLTLFFSIQMYCESKDVMPKNRIVLYAVGIVLLLLYRFLLVEQLRQIEITRFVLFNLGLHLLASFAPFMGSKNTKAFWQFNEILFIRFLTSALYSGVLYVGMVIAMVAVDQLFGVDINGKRYGELWVIVAGIFNTAFFLFGIPETKNLDEDRVYPKGLKIFTQFVLLPLVSLYLVILYGYVIKILIRWSLPVGWVSYLIVAFSVLGIFSLLLIYPIRNNDENKWIKTFSNAFFVAIIPLIGLLFVAIFYRLFEYGITEHRYFILVLAFWLLGMAAYFLLSKEYNIKIIPLSLAIICFASSFGPWGAFYVSKISQTNQLKKLLIANNILVNDKVVKSTKEISEKDSYQISSIIRYFDDTHGFKHLQPWFKQDLDTSLTERNVRYYYRSQSSEMHKLLGVKEVYYFNEDNQKVDTRYFNFTSRAQSVTNVSSYDYVVAYNDYSPGVSETDLSKGLRLDSVNTLKIKCNTNQKISAFINGKSLGSLDLSLVYKTLVPLANENSGTSISAYNLPLDSMLFYLNVDKSIAFRLQNMYGNEIKKKPDVNSINGDFLIRTTKK